MMGTGSTEYLDPQRVGDALRADGRKRRNIVPEKPRRTIQTKRGRPSPVTGLRVITYAAQVPEVSPKQGVSGTRVVPRIQSVPFVGAFFCF
jgi:hypothetical protein